MMLDLTEAECAWLLELVNLKIRGLRGSGRGTYGAQWARDLRALRSKLEDVARLEKDRS